jgi:flavin reductase (DIM6/NTAB) family NADH-FMN oxidoreductase RutF
MTACEARRHEPMSRIGRRAFRDALGWFATGVAIITTRTADGVPVGLTANSFSSVSLDPPLVLFSLNRRAGSLAVFQTSGSFAVNVLRHDQQDLSLRFAAASAERWQGVAVDIWSTGAPILRDALASFECRIAASHAGGDHVIFIGEVVRMQAEPHGQPLVFCRGGYRALAEAPEAPAHRPPPSPIGAELSLAGLEPWVAA